MKTSFAVLAVLGLSSVSGIRSHHHSKHHTRANLSNQQLQDEIEQLNKAYSHLEENLEKLGAYVHDQSAQQSFVQRQSPYGNAGPKGKGPALPVPGTFIKGEKQWMDNSQNIDDWGTKQEIVANTRIPYQSAVQAVGPYGNADKNGQGPTLPSPGPFVRGEKQWMDSTQNIGDWGENQMVVANSRIPYYSTAQEDQNVQIDSKYNIGLYGNAGPTKRGPTLPSPQPFVRGEKQWMNNAQNIGDWGDNQMIRANTRIPYYSAVQLDAEDIAPNGLAMKQGPALPGPAPFVRGEKQWMDNSQNVGQWGADAEDTSNARIPYNSTFVQLGDDKSTMYEDGVDLSILYEKEKIDTFPEKVVAASAQVPLSISLIQTKDDNPKNMEGMMMEDPGIPLNLRLIHLQNQDGDDVIKIEN